jgi:hypothetical protein
MTFNEKTPSAGDAEGLGSSVQLCELNDSTNILSQLRTQYLTEIFALSPDTAATIALLAFGGEA